MSSYSFIFNYTNIKDDVHLNHYNNSKTPLEGLSTPQMTFLV